MTMQQASDHVAHYQVPSLPGLVARESAEPGTLVELVRVAHENGWRPDALAVVIENRSGWDPRRCLLGQLSPEELKRAGVRHVPQSARRQLGRVVARYYRARLKEGGALVYQYAAPLRPYTAPEVLQDELAQTLGTARGVLHIPLVPRKRSVLPAVLCIAAIVILRRPV